MNHWNRRRFVTSLAAATACAPLPSWGAPFDPLKTRGKRVAIVGGGFGGTIAARILRLADPEIEVVLINDQNSFTACPLSNLVLSGTRDLAQNRIEYRKLINNHRIVFVQDTVTAIDPAKKTLTGTTGSLAYDRLIVSPGIGFRFEDIAGYQPATTPLVMPHAWRAGEQTLLLRQQLEAMPDGGTFLMTIPPAPFRAPGGPYERACLVASYFKRTKPNAKVLVLDANPDIVMKGELFRKAWATRFPGMVDYRPNHNVIRINAETKTVFTANGEFRGDVVNLIPPQRAGNLALASGLVGPDRRWCPVNPATFESTQVPNVHVIGDACSADRMPKTGVSANAQAKICAFNLAATLNGKPLLDPAAVNVTYSFVSDKEAISYVAVYKLADGKYVEIPDSGGNSPDISEKEWLMGVGWMSNILAEMST